MTTAIFSSISRNSAATTNPSGAVYPSSRGCQLVAIDVLDGLRLCFLKTEFLDIYQLEYCIQRFRYPTPLKKTGPSGHTGPPSAHGNNYPKWEMAPSI